jgi:enoyl-CoA hydratase/carnithine racemase
MSVRSLGAVRRELDGAACVLTLDRPRSANAYTSVMLAQLREHIEHAENDQSVRVIVVTGAGDSSFSAGADRTEIAERDWRSVFSLTSASVFARLRTSRCVTIAAINGVAVGGGMELTMACDLRIAVESARFWLPEPQLGILPAAGATALLPRLVGPLRAKELILGGAEWSARDAMNARFLSDVVPADELRNRVREWVARIKKRDPVALAFAKKLLDRDNQVGGTGSPELVAQSILVARNTDAVSRGKAEPENE